MKTFPLTLVLAASLASVGCSGIDRNEGPRPAVRIVDERAPNQRLNLDTVVILDKSLQDRKTGKLAVENSGARRTATGTVEAYAVIRNRTDHPLQIEGRTQFFDSMGIPLGVPSQWQRLYLDPQSINGYRELSTGTGEVAHYYIEIREGR
ncbi:hypothetical protein [Pseudomonas sp. MYb185]|uniref:hypothetical protein n=1 Tax=Pseudomonas sp. MYb185 TaxID=1848729 RepID=UPI000CFC8BA6|nr:hypothetical protein [Pseudomonas sp. MYb185]PRB82067.1 hypothetical protein CQ007_07845 [Pseudomonas sp. MYb185]